MLLLNNKLEIETRRLQSDIEGLRDHLNGLRQTGDSLMAEINALSAMWEGEAKNAFTAQFQSDYNTLKSMAEVIEDLIKDLEFARQQYDTCENSVSSLISSIRV